MTNTKIKSAVELTTEEQAAFDDLAIAWNILPLDRFRIKQIGLIAKLMSITESIPKELSQAVFRSIVDGDCIEENDATLQ